MEIKIDTEKDSHEQIRKAIHFLQTIIGDKAEASKPTQPQEDTGFFGMFDGSDNNPVKEEAYPSTESKFAVFDDDRTRNEPVSFSLDDELKRRRFNDESDRTEEDEDETPDVKIIPY